MARYEYVYTAQKTFLLVQFEISTTIILMLQIHYFDVIEQFGGKNDYFWQLDQRDPPFWSQYLLLLNALSKIWLNFANAKNHKVCVLYQPFL